ncbi:FadR/GntR family transcriptional regulator [Microbacterium koreense]|uniref:FadR/GntR family transcriptional regulator n=1 Tax=Microbacterium koreense TaxID=323761 RepID=A0ABW2ZQ49_9MICO
MTSNPPVTSGRPHRLQGSVFLPIGDAGRAELVEKRIAEAITGGHLRAGSRLPSEVDLARTMGVAPVTVREALLALRTRGLVTTKRGRNGGSFVSENADPFTFARDTLARSSSLALRDLGAHYAALTTAAIRLATRKAAPPEIDAIRARLARLTATSAQRDLTAWRQTMDDLQLELVALSQSARLTRDQMRLQAELSPLLRLIDTDEAGRTVQYEGSVRVLDAVAAGDENAAGAAMEEMVGDLVRLLESLRLSLDEA